MRVVKYIVLIAAVILLLMLLVFGSLVAVALHRAPAPEVVETSVQPAATIHIGEPVRLSAVVKLPWYRRLLQAPDIQPGEQRQLAGTPESRLKSIGFGHWSWTVSATVQATGFATQDDEDVRMRLLFTADRQGESEPLDIAFAFPEVVPRQLGDDKSLIPAGAVPAPPVRKAVNLWVIGGTVVLLLAVGGILLAVFLGQGIVAQAPPPPPWETAEKKLQELGDSLPLPPGVFFQTLTDVVRLYLEHRFHIPATEQTTPEFLAGIQASTLLSREQQDRLHTFLTSADMVKFAKAEATLVQMREALESAGQFVLETRPGTGKADTENQAEDKT